jgi:hypothetical protein
LGAGVVDFVEKDISQPSKLPPITSKSNAALNSPYIKCQKLKHMTPLAKAALLT